jgi:putative Holliday junction resolvase
MAGKTLVSDHIDTMPRILAIDYGEKRTGLAWTDPLRLFATALPGIDTNQVPVRLRALVAEGPVDTIVLGLPQRLDGRPTHATAAVHALAQRLHTDYPTLNVMLWDERFTSQMATQTLLEAGVNRKKRADKHTINSLSAVILLQHYLERQNRG